MKDLSGLKINCLGASNTRIIRGENGEKIKDINYPRILGLLLRCTTRNYGVSGTNIARCEDRADSYAERMPMMDRDADVVIFQGEGNDCSHCLPLGTPGDTDDTTFCGAVRTVIGYLRATFPQAKLIVLSGLDKKNPPKKRTDGLTHADFHRAFMETCRLCGAEAHDFTLDPQLRCDDPEAMPDGLHMSEKACRHYADTVADLIRAAF